MKKKKNLRHFGIYLSALFLLAACAPSQTSSPSEAPSVSSIEEPKRVTITLEDLPEAVEIHTDLQKDYLLAENPDTWIDQHYADISRKSLSAPEPISFSWQVEVDNGLVPSSYKLEVSETEDFVKARSITVKENSAEMTNFKLGSRYYWRVSASFDGIATSYLSEPKTFLVEDGPIRNLDVEGVENFRDFGGWKVEGGTIKQGLLYRSAEFNGDDKGVSAPTEKGIKTLKEELGIKADIDVRRTLEANDYDEVIGITSSPLGDDVEYVSLPMVFKGSNIYARSENKESIKSFFDYLADETHYPAVFHCVRGTDRTGALAYVLGALCGMSDDQLVQDYLFSDFANIGTSLVRFNNIDGESFYRRQIMKEEGETLAEQAENYLLNKIGVSHETVSAIQRIFIEKD